MTFRNEKRLDPVRCVAESEPNAAEGRSGRGGFADLPGGREKGAQKEDEGGISFSHNSKKTKEVYVCIQVKSFDIISSML